MIVEVKSLAIPVSLENRAGKIKKIQQRKRTDNSVILRAFTSPPQTASSDHTRDQ